MDTSSFDYGAFGRAVVRRRQRLGLNTHRLSERASIADPYLRKIENGAASGLGVDVMVRLAAALRTTPDTLLSEAGVRTAQDDTGHADISMLYADLEPPGRHVVLQTARAVREMQESYSTDAERAIEPTRVSPTLPNERPEVMGEAFSLEEEEITVEDLPNLAAYSNRYDIERELRDLESDGAE